MSDRAVHEVLDAVDDVLTRAAWLDTDRDAAAEQMRLLIERLAYEHLSAEHRTDKPDEDPEDTQHNGKREQRGTTTRGTSTADRAGTRTPPASRSHDPL